MAMSEWNEYKLRDVRLKIGCGATPTGGGNSYKLLRNFPYKKSEYP